MLNRLIKRFLGNQKPEPIIPKISLDEILPSEIAVDLIEPEAKNGNVTLSELVILSQLVKLSKPEKIFEIGTFDGRTTINLSRSSLPTAKIFTLDLGQKEIEELSKNPHGDRKFIGKVKPGQRFEGRPEAKKIIQLLGNSSKFDFSVYKNLIDFMFVDGAHQYEYVLKDSETALQITKPGGTILWHDYNTSWPGVTKALNELHKKDLQFKNLRNINGTSLVYLKL